MEASRFRAKVPGEANVRGWFRLWRWSWYWKVLYLAVMVLSGVGFATAVDHLVLR